MSGLLSPHAAQRTRSLCHEHPGGCRQAQMSKRGWNLHSGFISALTLSAIGLVLWNWPGVQLDGPLGLRVTFASDGSSLGGGTTCYATQPASVYGRHAHAYSGTC